MLQLTKKHFLFLIGLLCSFALTAQAGTVSALMHQVGDPIGGNPNGNVTVVEFFDYQCGHCASMAPVMQSLIKANPNLRIVYKELPIRGPVSEFAARATLAANLQGKYATLSHDIFAAEQPLTQTMILDFAKQAGVNMLQLKKDMHSRAMTDALNNNAKLAAALKINGTPAFFIGKTNESNVNALTFVLGEMSANELQTAIDKASA